MIGKEAKEKGYANIEDVYDILKSRKPAELKYEQQVVLDYVTKFKANKKVYTKVSSILEDTDLPESIKSKILEVLPKSESLLKQILASEKVSMPDEKRAELLKAISENA
jgi:Uncharacterized protein conserved in archaea